MNGGLREALGLPEGKGAASNGQTDEFRRTFLAEMAKVNRDLQSAAGLASRADFEQLDALRLRLYEAFQAVSTPSRASDAQRVEQGRQRVMAAVSTVAGKASALAGDAATGSDRWSLSAADFDEIMLGIADIETAGHPKAALFRKLGDAIRTRANDRRFQDAVAALDQLRPKLIQILAEFALAAGGNGAVSGETNAPVRGQFDADFSGEVGPIGPTPTLPGAPPAPTTSLPPSPPASPATPGAPAAPATPAAERDLQASCLIQVVNHSNALLTLLDQGHERGDFMKSPDPAVQPGGNSDFVSVETPNGPDDGCKGFAVWEVGAPGECTWRIEWDNSEQEKNTTTSTLSGPGAKNYRELDQIGQGDENVPTVFTLSNAAGGAPPASAKTGTVSFEVSDVDTGKIIDVARMTVAGNTLQSGRGTFVSIPAGEQSYEATADGYVPQARKAMIVEGETTELLVALRRQTDATDKFGSLMFEITDADSGQQIGAAQVTVAGETYEGGFGIVSQVAAGDQAYQVAADGYESQSGNLTVADGLEAKLQIKLKKAVDQIEHATVLIDVRDRLTNVPIAGAHVAVGELSGQTDSAGIAKFGVEPGEVAYTVRMEPYQESSGTIDVPNDTEYTKLVLLQKATDWNPPAESKQPTLRKKDTSADGWVEYLQKLLNKHLGGNAVQVNGEFDDATYAAVKKFQSIKRPNEKPLLVDGVVGNETWSFLRKAPRDAVGTDGRKPHEFVEKGAEARWATEKNDFVAYVRDSDQIWILAFSVGDQPLQKSASATVRITGADGTVHQPFSVPLGDPDGPSPDDRSQKYTLKIPDVARRFGAGVLLVEAYFEPDLGGDKWKGKISVGQNSPNADVPTPDPAAAPPRNNPRKPTRKTDPRKKPATALTYNAASALIDTLVFLAQPKFQRASDKPGPPQLASAHEPSVDDLLEQAAQVVRLWNAPKTLPEALRIWKAVRPRVTALIAEAADPSLLGLDAAALKPARDAVATITDYLSIQDSSFSLDAEVQKMPTPELSKELDARLLKKLEPSLNVWKETIALAGPTAGPKLKSLSQTIDLYFSVPSPSAKLDAFKKAGLLKQDDSLGKLAPFLMHLMAMSAGEVTEHGIHAAAAAAKAGAKGAHEAVESLEKRLKIVRVVGGAVGFYEVAKGTYKLLKGIKNDDWHMIAEGGATLALGAVGLAEATGVVSTAGAAAATVGIVAIWGVAEVVIMAAEQARWAKQVRALVPFKRMLADSKKIIPHGKQMAAAVQLMQKTENATDPVDVANNERYRLYAIKAADKVAKGLKSLVDLHFNEREFKNVGRYPELISAVTPMLRKAYSEIDYRYLEATNSSDAAMFLQTLVDAFDATVKAIQIMSEQGDRLFGAEFVSE